MVHAQKRRRAASSPHGDIDPAAQSVESGATAERDTLPQFDRGDPDAWWDEAVEEGGGEPSTTRDEVGQIGWAIGLTYEEGEALRVGDKENERDRHRWELDPASSEDYRDRLRPAVEADVLLAMSHTHRTRTH
jgi:Family of unknown function (DUF6335)